MSLCVAFYRGTDAVALVYDASEARSVAHLGKWRAEFEGQSPPVPMVVLANKADQGRPEVLQQGRQWCLAGGLPHYETSALTGQGVEGAFEGLAALLGEPREREEPLMLGETVQVEKKEDCKC